MPYRLFNRISLRTAPLRMLATVLTVAALLLGVMGGAQAEKKQNFRIAWSIYVGWMPWGYAQDEGIVKKWADKYGIAIEVVRINDYIESINQYTGGAFDGVVMTNMDGLTIPAAGGVDTSVILMGDFSDGNDAVVLKGKDKLADIKGQYVNLVELSVSHYLLARALESVGMSEKDVTVVNTSDADIVGAFTADEVTAATMWNPQLAEVLAMKNANKVFDSSQIPGEIIDLLAVNTETLKANPDLGKALVGAWFETMAIMSKDDEAGRKARAAMGAASGTDQAGYEAQLGFTRMFYTPAEALEFAMSEKLIETMDLVRKFSFDHGLLGEGAQNIDAVGMEFPGGKTLGDPANIKFRFNADYVKMATEGAL